jgi:hypothetical protein
MRLPGLEEWFQQHGSRTGWAGPPFFLSLLLVENWLVSRFRCRGLVVSGRKYVPGNRNFRALYHCRSSDFWLFRYEIRKLINAESKQRKYHNLSWEVCLEIICLLWKPKVHYHFTRTLSSLGQTNPAHIVLESSWNVMAHGDAREGKWKGNWRMEWVASPLHTTSEHGVSSITTADAHISAASSRLNWRPRRFKWTRPFRRKMKSGFCACAITFQTQSTFCLWWSQGRPVPEGRDWFCMMPHWTRCYCSRLSFVNCERCAAIIRMTGTSRTFSA